MTKSPTLDPGKICFGLSEELDQKSLVIFLQLFGGKEFAELFAGRLSSTEIEKLTDHIMMLLRRHLSEDEYHAVFLQDSRPHH